jgi:uncharacterized membrane protein (TIGR02234 family)
MTDAAPRSPRYRLYAVTAILLAGAIGIISSTQPWLVVTLRDGGEPLSIAGADAMPVLAPLSLAALALGLVLPIVGTVLRYVFGALAAAIAVTLGILTGQLLFAQPVSAYAGAVTEATGIAGTDAVADLVSSLTITAWPWIALIGWVLMLAASLLVVITARRWQTGGRRFRASAPTDTGKPLDAIDSWDELSRGTDPTR